MPKLLAIIVLPILHLSLHAGEIALTFDDAPRPDTSLYTGGERTSRLINSLRAVNVEAMFFVVGQAIDSKNVSRLKQYSSAGHKLANHSYAHQSANRVSASTFFADFEKSHKTLFNLPSYQPVFRYPFLHKGDTTEKQRRIYDHMVSAGYTIGYITVDNFDWYMDNLLQQAIQQGKIVDHDKLKNLYVDVLWQAIQFYDNLAIQTLGRSPKHVLLLHENDLAALYIDDLVKHIRAQGWRIITPADAYTDAIATYAEESPLGNQGRIAEIAKAKGVPDSELRHESEEQSYLRKLFEQEGVFE